MKKIIPLFSAAVFLTIIYSCSSEEPINFSNIPPTTFSVEQLFSEMWTGEMSAMAYDSVSGYLYYIRSTNSVPNEVHRYSFATGQIDTIYSYQSQWDYGVRVFNGDLHIVRTYDESILRLTNLSTDTLTKVNIYPDSVNTNTALTEINDITIVNGNIYFVCGNMLGSMQHNGIQYLQGPDFTTVNELLSSADANWPDSAYGYTRSILSLGSGASAKFVIATGPNGNIELRDAAGNFVKADSGYGDSYLQKDSQNRIYTITGSGNNTKLTRWSENLDKENEYTLLFSQYGGGNGIRFVLRETGSNIEIIMVRYRSSNPVFYKATIPN
jgi:hypothetical protein